MLNAGVEKVIWILTDSRKIMVAEQGQTRLLEKWSEAIPVVDDVCLRIDELVEQIVETEQPS